MKKFTKVALAAGLAVSLTSAAFAGGYSRAEMATMPHPCGVHGLGVSLESPIGDYFGTQQGVVDFGKNYRFGLNYVVQQWEMGMTFSGFHFDTTPNVSSYDLGLHAGYRWPLFHCLFGSVGAHFNWNHFHNVDTTAGLPTDTVNFYTFGAYLGLSWEPTEHIALFGRVHALDYSYARNETTNTSSDGTFNFFEAGEVGVAYYFGDVV